MAFWNCIHENMSETDRDLFLGPDQEQDQFVEFTDQDEMCDLMVKVGKFPSRTQARKNGHDKPIPAGFSEHRVGKNQKQVILYVLNRFEDE